VDDWRESGPQSACAASFWHNERMGKSEKVRYVDPGWPQRDHPVTELATDWSGALSPFGETEFPLPGESLPYVHPSTQINR
jgi:hypothetical protein